MKTKLRIIQEKKKKITNEVTERDTQDRGWIKTKKWHKNLYFERLERNWFKKKREDSNKCTIGFTKDKLNTSNYLNIKKISVK